MAEPVAAANAFTDPPANRDLSEATLRACQTGPTSAACQTAALADINAARAAEGLGPMQLPGEFSSLTVPQQLLVLSDLERVDRGLVAVSGLSGPLDQDALTGAQNDRDPIPTQFNGDTWTANWEGGYASPVEADFVWMYDDGFGSNNIDCTSPSDMGCWGHRHDILWPLDAPAVMGAANAQGQFGASQTELVVGGDRATAPGQADAPLAPTWATIAATLRTGSAARTIVAGSATTIAGVLRRSIGTGTGTGAGAGVGAGGLIVVLTGPAAGAPKATTVTHATTTATGAVSFRVRPQVNTTYHLVFTGTPALSAASGAPVRIDVAPRITAALAHRPVPAGTAVTLSGTVTPAPGSHRLALQVKPGRRWVTIAHTRAQRTGRYRFTIRPGRGSSRYRVMLPATSTHARGLSATRALPAT